jgi:serine protease inhibitor
MKRRSIVLLCTAGMLAACSAGPTEVQRPPAELTVLPRALSAEETNVRDAANRFSLALWETVNAAQRDSNVFLSPLSASFALGMTLNGAAGSTYYETRDALQFGGVPLAAINQGYRSLIALLTSLDSGVRMTLANSIWYRQDFPFHQAFFDTTSKYFGARSEGLDFDAEAASLAVINGWVSDATATRIPKVLDAIDPDHVMFLINAIYFKGSWRTRFDPARTQATTFRASSGVDQPAHLMQRTDTVRYLEAATFQAVELPYGNTAFVMNVLLPAPGVDIEAFAASLPAAALQSASYTPTMIALHLPRLRLEYGRKLNDDLRALGMQVPFATGADFTPMSPAGNQLFIDFVRQNTFVEINEEGTEAAAVTVVGIGRVSLPSYPVMRVDRPYVFVIRERLSGTILFMGKIVSMP